MRRLPVVCSLLLSARRQCARPIERPLDVGRGRRLFRLRGQLHESDSDDDLSVEGHLCVAVRFEDRSIDADRACRRNGQSSPRVGAPERQVPVRGELGRWHAGRSRERVCDRSPDRHAQAHQQSEREGRSREPGRARSERQARRNCHLQQRHLLGVWRRGGRQAHRGVLHRSAHRQAAQREAARPDARTGSSFRRTAASSTSPSLDSTACTRTASIRSSGRPCRPTLRSSR